jgi:hypothetical protein
MQKELIDYITLSRSNGRSDQDIKANLLSKGWNIKDVEESLFILNGGDKSVLSYSNQEEARLKNRNRFSLISLGLWIFSFLLYILITYFITFSYGYLLILLASFVGLVFGILGLSSRRKIMASFAMLLNIIVIIWLCIISYVAFQWSNGIDPFSGEQLSPEQIIDINE